MTVIVYRDGMMAADGGSWQGDVVVQTNARKIRRLSNGHLCACCGSRPDIDEFFRWMESGDARNTRPDVAHMKEGDFGGIVAGIDGVWKVDWMMRLYRVDADWLVDGSHTEFLNGALAMGATAEQAVREAVKYCMYASGNVQVERINGDSTD